MANKELTPDFKKIFDSMPTLLLVLLPDSPRFTIVAASDIFLKITMTIRDKILGKGIFEIFPNNPEDPTAVGAQSLRDSLLRVINDRLPNKMKMLQYDIRRPEEEGGGYEKRFWSPISIPILGDDGQVINILHSVNDITQFVSGEGLASTQENANRLESEIVQYTQYLQEEKRNIEQNYQMILESVKEYAIYTIDSNGIITNWNSSAEDIKGYKASEVLGKNFSMFYGKKDIENNKPFQELKIAAEKGNYTDEGLRIRKGGSEFWASVVISSIRGEKGELKGYVKIVRDITQQKKIREALETMNERLEARVKERTRELVLSNQELEHFAYIASHDLQAPLRHITSYVQLLIDKVKVSIEIDEESKKWIEYIINGTLQMKMLIDDLLAYSRVGRTDVAVEEVDITKLIEDVIESLQEDIRKTGAKIEYSVLPVVFGVRSQLHQLFQNLIENAIKFKKSDLLPIVKIKCEDLDEVWKFTISDNGIGIDLKYSGKLFTMFQRLNTSREYSGTGIGLAVCKKIIGFCGGQIGVDSSVGKGASFFFTIPKKRATIFSY